MDLYELELRQVTKDTPRFAALSTTLERMEKNQRMLEKLEGVRRENASRNPSSVGTAVFQDESFKKNYFVAYRLWNKDENQEALAKALELSASPQFKDLSEKEQFKALNLQFRIALDLQSVDVAAKAYAAMRELDDCEAETAEAGFLISLTYLGAGDAPKAKATFDRQCDPDESAPNQIKRLYWSARLREANGETATEDYARIADSGVPGYYYYLAHARLNRKMQAALPERASYFKAQLKVSSEVADLFKEAETSLSHSLRMDAATYLAKATALLKEEVGLNEVPALLYAAHLYQAAGLQIEAMKIYAVVTEFAMAQYHTVPFDFLKEMFPTPHRVHVDRMAVEWKVDPDFIYAIMRQESAFNPGAVSSANASGLMQMMPFLGARLAKLWSYESYYGRKTLFFAQENLRFASYHLHELQAQMPHPALMAAAYNAGSRRASNWWKRGPGLPLDVFVELIPVAETRNYVKLVLRNFTFYKMLRNDGKLDPSAVSLRLPDPTALTL